MEKIRIAFVSNHIVFKEYNANSLGGYIEYIHIHPMNIEKVRGYIFNGYIIHESAWHCIDRGVINYIKYRTIPYKPTPIIKNNFTQKAIAWIKRVFAMPKKP